MSAPRTLAGLLDIAAVPARDIAASARTMARFSLFDWMVVARAGADEPVARIVRDLVTEEAGRPAAMVVGGRDRVPARAAALANGTISHALDYDDTHFAHVGHPSVGILPAALAAAEMAGASAAEACDAFLLGAEASVRIGMVLGRGHYERGFHQTATAGAFGATVAAGRVLGLTREQMRQALSLVATRASGLKSQFGTMGKPFNAGIAASNGVEAALLARRGFVSADDGVGGPQGFVETHSQDAFEQEAWAEPPPARFIFEDVKYKLHACCHGTHAMIEALAEARAKHGVHPDRVERIDLRVNPRWLRVCDIKEPRTGLEAKFSYALLAAMVLSGVDTSADRTYTDALCADPALRALAARVRVVGDQSVPDTATEAVVGMSGGEAVHASHDLAARLPADSLERGLRGKARGLLGEDRADRFWSAVAHLDAMSARELADVING